jgi:hypothetical protein
LEGEEVALWRLTSLSPWSKAKFKSPCNFEESPYVATRIFSPLVIYENVDIVQQNELLIYFFSFLWHKIIVLISNMFINAKFVEMHVDASDIYPSASVFYTRHRVNITIYRTVYLHTDMCLQTLTHIQLKSKLWTTVAFLRCCNLIWGLANNNYSLYFLQFLTISHSVAIYICAIFSFPTVLRGPLLNLWLN